MKAVDLLNQIDSALASGDYTTACELIPGARLAARSIIPLNVRAGLIGRTYLALGACDLVQGNAAASNESYTEAWTQYADPWCVAKERFDPGCVLADIGIGVSRLRMSGRDAGGVTEILNALFQLESLPERGLAAAYAAWLVELAVPLLVRSPIAAWYRGSLAAVMCPLPRDPRLPHPPPPPPVFGSRAVAWRQKVHVRVEDQRGFVRSFSSNSKEAVIEVARNFGTIVEVSIDDPALLCALLIIFGAWEVGIVTLAQPAAQYLQAREPRLSPALEARLAPIAAGVLLAQ